MTIRVGLRHFSRLAQRKPPVIYLGLWTVPAIIVEVTTIPFAKGRTLTLNTDEDVLRRSHSLLVHNNLLYAGTIWPATVVKVNRLNMTRLAGLVLETGVNDDIYGMAINGNYLYAGMHMAPGRIWKVDLNTFTKDASLDLNTGENNIFDIAISGDYLYALCGVDPTLIVKVDLTTFTRVGVLNLTQPTFRYRWGAPLLVVNGYLYAGATTTWPVNNEKLAKIDLSTFTKVDEVADPSTWEYFYDLLRAGDNIYSGHEQNTNNVGKTSLSPFATVAQLTCPITGAASGVTCVGYDGAYLYATTDYARKITRIDLATFTRVDELIISEGQPWALAVAG